MADQLQAPCDLKHTQMAFQPYPRGMLLGWQSIMLHATMCSPRSRRCMTVEAAVSEKIRLGLFTGGPRTK